MQLYNGTTAQVPAFLYPSDLEQSLKSFELASNWSLAAMSIIILSLKQTSKKKSFQMQAVLNIYSF